MRILIKGGVWKNTEDEILKAAVMKYGKNQWARVSSLLSRKSAKQCKSRWYEWLDPSIKKTEWSKEEEEKLLHLAKLMPNQWRTIAPIVNRTAGQCIEHYEKLLDQAQENMEESTEDPRRLRPGEIDPSPETKPARPDPIDMDEDEKEMLSEARARLANTKGKKAKRKARERQLDESRRFSMLQKRRELKAAGISSKLGTGGNKRKYMDYVKEIPFQKLAPSGFYDVGEEDAQAKSFRINPKQMGLEVNRMEGRHAKEEEARAQSTDKKRMKTLFKENAPLAVTMVSDANDPTTLRRRSALSLPSPQVSDSELEEIVKIGQNALMAPPVGGLQRLNQGQAATQALVGDYSKSFLATPTPMRTPVHEDMIMQEARNLRILRDMQPMAAADLEELTEGTGFEGCSPRVAKLATPNVLLAATPGGARSVAHTPAGSVMSGFGSLHSNRTPMRDQFGLNDQHADSFSVSDMASVSSRGGGGLRSRITEQLHGLPEPEYTYEVSIPKVAADEGDGDSGLLQGPEDATEVEKRMCAHRQEEEAKEQARKSTVLRRHLPRPAGALAAVSSALSHSAVANAGFGQLLQPNDSVAGAADPALAQASCMINEEMLWLLAHDELRYPDTSVGGKTSMLPADADRFAELLQLSDEELASAKDLVRQEMTRTDSGSGCVAAVGGEEFAEIWAQEHKQRMFIPSRGPRGAFGVPKNESEHLSSLATQFTAIKARVDKDMKRANKLESKLQLVTQGYCVRAGKLNEGVQNNFDSLVKHSTDLVCFRTLMAVESRAIVRRLEQMKNEMTSAEDLEAQLQARYRILTDLIQN